MLTISKDKTLMIIDTVTVEDIVTRETDKKLEWGFNKSAKILHADETFAVFIYRYVIRSKHPNKKASSMWQVCVKARYLGGCRGPGGPCTVCGYIVSGAG